MSSRTPARRRRTTPSLQLVVLLVMLPACVSSHDHKGVENVWRNSGMPEFQAGVTKRAQVLELLGPPSQVIDQDEGIIFYYMRERVQGKGVFLIVYNTTRVNIDYDRAIFFFDAEDVLVEHAYSKTEFPAPEPK